MRHIVRTAILALGLGIAAVGQTQTTPTLPVGLVDDPCIGAPQITPGLERYRQSQFDRSPGAKIIPPPAAELAAYRAAQAEQVKRDWAALCRYRADNARLAGRPAAEHRIVFIGDSITENWSVAHPGFFANGVINRGISGQTTPQMLVRFEADVIALQPKAVHIMAGTNDLAGNTGPTTMLDIRNNIIAMVALARANGIRVFLASTPPAGAFSWRPGLKPAAQIIQLNDWLRSYAKRVGATYLDYHAALATSEGALRRELSPDGVHPNNDGYAAMEPIARRAISSLR
ncbi:SGNH/GDSL hydrolase family protein [Sphingomonas sp.]|uniref:SGNH/GDSL hydrolase family protein n=1 Tax=Sphingomonas sp. TaxID=28214 RepID=UPI003D6D55E9